MAEGQDGLPAGGRSYEAAVADGLDEQLHEARGGLLPHRLPTLALAGGLPLVPGKRERKRELEEERERIRAGELGEREKGRGGGATSYSARTINRPGADRDPVLILVCGYMSCLITIGKKLTIILRKKDKRREVEEGGLVEL